MVRLHMPDNGPTMRVMTRPGASLPELLMLARARTDVSDADAAVYRAALRVLGRTGTRHATVDAIAREYGASRMTLFRKFGSKDEILSAAIAWALGRLWLQTVDVIERTPHVPTRIEEVFVLCCGLGRTLLPRGAVEERATLFADDRIETMDLGIQFVAAVLAQDENTNSMPPNEIQIRADALARLTTACFTIPPAPFDIDDENAARRYARTALVPIVTG